ncbi:MAG: hypothetical protein Q8T03_00395 [Bacteroidota bacterium]|nr:hypothetical protein [Bacteroidota bacterium]
MKKITVIYFQYALSVIFSLNAVMLISQNEILFPTDSIMSKNPFYLFNVIDKGNGILETKYITYLECIIKAPDERIITGEIYGSDKKIIKFSNKLMALIIQQINHKGEKIGEPKVIRIAFRNLNPDVEYFVKPKIDADLRILSNNMKVEYGLNNYETIPELNNEEKEQLKDLFAVLYKKGTYKKYYLESAKINKIEATESIEKNSDAKSLKFSKNEKLIKTKEINQDETYFFTQTKKSDNTKGKLFKIYNRKELDAPLTLIDSLFFAEETNSELEEIEFVNDLKKNKPSGLLLQFRNFSKSSKGFDFVYLGFDNKIQRAFSKKDDNKMKNFAIKTVYKDSNDIVIINFNNSGLTKGELNMHVFSKDSIYKVSSIDPTDTLITKKMSADENSWKNDDGYNSRIIFSKKTNSTIILIEQSELLETSSGMISNNGYIPNNFNRGYCHTNMYFIKDNTIKKKYTLYSDYFNLKPIDYINVCEENDELTLLLEAQNNIMLKYNQDEILKYKTVEASNKYLFKSPVTKKYYFDYENQKYYYYNDPITKKIFLKKI